MKHAFRLTAPFALALALAACSASPEERFARARDAYAQHDYAAARLDLASVIKEQPDNAAANELLARTYIELGQADSAKAALDRLVRLGKAPQDLPVLKGEVELLAGRHEAAIAALGNDPSAGAQRVRAMAYLGMNRVADAAKAFAAGEAAPGDRARLLADYAHFQLAQGDMVEARRLAALAARGNPRPLASYLASADVLAADSQLGKALEAFDAALKVYPQSRAALLGKIRVLDALDRGGEARPLIAQALAEDSGDPTLLFMDARYDALDGDWKKVRDKLQAHERMLDQEPQANALYAKALLELGQAEQARTRLSSQLLRTPGDRRARLLLGESKLVLGDAADAAATLRPFASVPDATSEELGLLAKALQASNDPGAEAMAVRARQAAGNRVLSRLATADKALRARDWATAVQRYEAILSETDGKNALVLNNLAYAYGQTGDNEKALQFAEKALTLAPDNASVMDTTGWLLHRSSKDRSRALTLLREATQKAPGNATIAAHLAQAEKK